MKPSRRWGLEANVAVETDQREAIDPLVRAAAGIAVSPQALAEDAATSDVVIRDVSRLCAPERPGAPKHRLPGVVRDRRPPAPVRSTARRRHRAADAEEIIMERTPAGSVPTGGGRIPLSDTLGGDSATQNGEGRLGRVVTSTSLLPLDVRGEVRKRRGESRRVIPHGDSVGDVRCGDVDSGPLIDSRDFPGHGHRAGEGRIVGDEVHGLHDPDVRN